VAKLNDLRDHSWVVICARIRNREHPREDDLAAALRRGEVVPPEAQAYLANLLEGRIDRRGQRRNKRRKWSETELMLLQMQMDEFVYRHTLDMKSDRRRGARDRKVVQRAQEDLVAQHHLEPETIQLYLRQAAELMQIQDAALALNSNEERQRLEGERAADPLSSALELAATKSRLPLWSVKARYERGKRWILANVEDGPEFK
jgi:hypothetical protein